MEPSPPAVIAEKFKFLAYYEALAADYQHKTRLLKFEEKLAGRRRIPKRGYRVGGLAEVFDKNRIRRRVKITGKSDDGQYYYCVLPGERKTTTVKAEQLQPT